MQKTRSKLINRLIFESDLKILPKIPHFFRIVTFSHFLKSTENKENALSNRYLMLYQLQKGLNFEKNPCCMGKYLYVVCSKAKVKTKLVSWFLGFLSSNKTKHITWKVLVWVKNGHFHVILWKISFQTCTNSSPRNKWFVNYKQKQ